MGVGFKIKHGCLDFSNDTAALAPKGPLTVARGAFAGATGNADYGWWFGAQL